MFPKIDALFDLLGISPLNPTDIMAFFRSFASQAVTVRKEESSVRDLCEISKRDFVWYLIYVRYRKRSRSLRDLYQMILVIYQEMGLFDTWFIKISGCGIDWYIIFVKKRSGIVGCLIFEMSGKEIDSTWSMWMGRA